MFGKIFEAIADLKSKFLALFLKSYPTQSPPPKRYSENVPDDVDVPLFRDRYAERNSDIRTQEIHEKVKQAVSDLRSKGFWWKGCE